MAASLALLPPELIHCIAGASSVPRSRFLTPPRRPTPEDLSDADGDNNPEGRTVVAGVDVDTIPTPILSLQDIRLLSSTCRRLRSCLTDPLFGAWYLSRDAASLVVSITIRTPVSSFDVFDYGILLPPKETSADRTSESPSLDSFQSRPEAPSSDSASIKQAMMPRGVFLHQRAHPATGPDPPSSVVHEIWMRASGAVDVVRRRLPKTANCNALAKADQSLFETDPPSVCFVNNYHRSNCRLCGIARVSGICAHVDKNYRVFLQTWLDSHTITLDDGLKVIINLMHVPPADAGTLWRMMGDPSTPSTSDSEAEVTDMMDELSASSPIGPKGSRIPPSVPRILRDHKGVWNPPSALVEVTRYGISVGRHVGSAVERFFGMGEKDHDAPLGAHQSRVGHGRVDISANPPVRRVPIYNPWQ
ncbi:hypothetical protein HDU67_006185 [Dinochytrium kinnereticum]|nr:hypothetical protein HDU67_006185 [Dinochytrium kinnereticum]